VFGDRICGAAAQTRAASDSEQGREIGNAMACASSKRESEHEFSQCMDRRINGCRDWSMNRSHQPADSTKAAINNRGPTPKTWAFERCDLLYVRLPYL
jgi:hypothetical protein